MKLLLLLYFALIASGINAYATELTEILKLTQNVNQYVTACIEESGDGEYEINKDPVTDIFSDEEDPNRQKITKCFFHKAGILEPEGKLNIDAALAVLSLLGIEKNEADELLQNCTSITGFDSKDTAYAIFKCFEDGVKAT